MNTRKNASEVRATTAKDQLEWTKTLR